MKEKVRRKKNMVEEEVEALRWKIDSSSYAASTIPIAQYEQIILDGYLHAPIEIVEGIVDAYGLKNKSVIRDLVKLSKGDLLNHLNADYPNWREHGHIDNTYWDVFREHFPAVADTLTVHFQARCITGTTVEQTFSLAATQIKENQTAGTNSKNMNHASSVKGSIVREMRDFKEVQSVINKRKRKHMFRSCKNQSYYIRSLCNYGVMLSDSVRVNGKINLPTVIEMRSKGKKINELKHSLPHTVLEMKANAPKGLVKIDGRALLQSIKESTTAKINNWDNLPAPEMDKYEEGAKRMKTDALRKLLKTFYASDKEKCKEISTMIKGENSVSSNTLMNLLVNYWKEHGLEPPAVLPSARLSQEIKDAMSMSLPNLREHLLQIHAGDLSMCEIIRKASKGNAQIKNSLVGMIFELSNVTSVESSAV